MKIQDTRGAERVGRRWAPKNHVLNKSVDIGIVGRAILIRQGIQAPGMEILADPGHWDGSRPDEANHSCHDAMQGPAARLHPRIEDRARAA